MAPPRSGGDRTRKYPCLWPCRNRLPVVATGAILCKAEPSEEKVDGKTANNGRIRGGKKVSEPDIYDGIDRGWFRGGHPGSVPHSRPLIRDSHLGKLTTETATKKGAQPQCGGKSMAILCELDSNRVGWLVGSIAVITAAEANGER